MGLQIGGVDHRSFLLAVLGSQPRHHLRENAFVAPMLPAVVERLVGAIVLRRISPVQSIAINKNNPNQDAPIIDGGLAMGLWEVGLQTRHLRITELEEIRHVIARFCAVNHALPLRSMGFEPRRADRKPSAKEQQERAQSRSGPICMISPAAKAV